MRPREKGPSTWVRLEELGFADVVMVERMRALRALDNARGGPLSRKERPRPAPERELLRLLKELLAAA